MTLKDALQKICDPKTDSLRYYFLGSNYKRRIEHYGAKPAIDIEDPLVL